MVAQEKKRVAVKGSERERRVWATKEGERVMRNLWQKVVRLDSIEGEPSSRERICGSHGEG